MAMTVTTRGPQREIMQTDTENTWSLRYQAALGKFIRKGPGAALQAAEKLGRQAVIIGLQTLDVARIHEQSLATALNGSSAATQSKTKRAILFFTETIVPIEKTHRAAIKADAKVHQLTRTLRLRTHESSVSARRLKQNILRRKGAEKCLVRSGKQHAQLLAESHRLQQRVRRLMRKITAAQEHQRKKHSIQLQDEIAQNLIAVNLRLLTLKKENKAGTARLKKEVADTQRLVRKSFSELKRFAYEFVKDPKK